MEKSKVANLISELNFLFPDLSIYQKLGIRDRFLERNLTLLISLVTIVFSMLKSTSGLKILLETQVNPAMFIWLCTHKYRKGQISTCIRDPPL